MTAGNSIENGSRAGGLAGYAENAPVNSSYATGNVKVGNTHPGAATAAAGGLIAGANSNVTNSYATGSVTVGDKGVGGGLLAGSPAVVSGSFATGAVKGGTHSIVGGLSGVAFTTFTNCYARGVVTGGNGSTTGGLVGQFWGNSSQSTYSIGHVSGGKYVGGFAGDSSHAGQVSGYWDTTRSGTSQGSGNGTTGLVGLTDTQLKSGLPAGFDPAIWGQLVRLNNDYPYLLANPPPK